MGHPPTYPRDPDRVWDILTFGSGGRKTAHEGVPEDQIRTKAIETIGSLGEQHFAVAQAGGQNYQFGSQDNIDYWWPDEIYG